MPRDKVNRAEHRGFGFVTFETEAAVARANAHGQHQIRCARAGHLAIARLEGCGEEACWGGVCLVCVSMRVQSPVVGVALDVSMGWTARPAEHDPSLP